MARNRSRPATAGQSGADLGNRKAPQPSIPEYSATGVARQVPVSSPFIPSIDRTTFGPCHHLLWLARRARVSLAHASALAEANSFGVP